MKSACQPRIRSSSIPVTAALFFSLMMGFGCATIPESIPIPSKTTWVFDADFDTRASARVAIGDTRSAVIASLGDPASHEHFKADPSVEVLHFARVAIGPRRIRTVKSVGGFVEIADNARYNDEITVYLKSDVVASVTLYRSIQK